MKQLNLPMIGMPDIFGLELRRRQYVQATLADLARSCGYEQIEVPLVERASSFAEEVIGRSPWPEWDQRGCFYLQVPDYSRTYDEPPELVEALLIPEGTISVTRWLGKVLAEDPGFVFPLKLFYETPCFRNELISTLKPGKARSFYQFGMEILGAGSGLSDVEAIYLITKCLVQLGVPGGSVQVRIGDVAIFNRLAELSGLGPSAAISLKEILDALAECRAGKDIARQPALLAEMSRLFDRNGTHPRWTQIWSGVAASGIGSVAEMDDQVIRQRRGELGELLQSIRAAGGRATIDLCVVRSHEYYTGIAFEVDVRDNGFTHVEVGGGGRYDRLVGNFMPEGDGYTVPATGFAFGLERLVAVLDSLRLLDRDSAAAGAVSLRAGSADVLIVPEAGSAGYQAAARLAEAIREQGSRVDVYLGNAESARRYASVRGIPVTQKVQHRENS